ncbi:hypothetical protein EOL73_02325 [Candidatus Saccharibacteria bacterium]|nr:hypothetical protein [Candidatus Saccharibacteria bacterium]NCU40572.1 hypothetical protein [Candidatus Saccharibacteria bacterium]
MNFKKIIIIFILSLSICVTPFYTNSVWAADPPSDDTLGQTFLNVVNDLTTVGGIAANPLSAVPIVATNLAMGEEAVPLSGSSATGAAGDAVKDAVADYVCNANFAFSWMACPMQENLININRAGYDIISGLLEFRPDLIEAGQGNAVYDYWIVFRNIANLVFLVGLVAVIFSQATSLGLSAYGVKKLLPRLLALAILINLSFFMCQVLIDLSNIVGSGIVDLSEDLIDSTTAVDPGDTWDKVSEMITKGGEGGGEAATAVTAGAALLITAPMIVAMALPIMIVAFLAIVLGLVVLVARQIIIVGMVVLSPVAIAAAALPGTKRLYEFWKKTFASMLFMFPIISLLFAGSQLAASLIYDMDPPFFLPELFADGVVEYITTLVIVIILVAPFFAIPFVIKTSGGMLGKLTGAIDKMTVGKARDYGKKRLGEYREDRRNQYASNLDRKQPFNPRAYMARRTIARKERYRNNDEASKVASAKIAARSVENDPKAGEAARARARAMLSEIDNKEAEIKLKFTYNGDATKALVDAIDGGRGTDQALINAATSKLIGENRLGTVQEKMRDMSSKQLQSTASSILNDGAQYSRVREQDVGFSMSLGDAAQAKYKTGETIVYNPATGKNETKGVFDDAGGAGLSGKAFIDHFTSTTPGVTNYYDSEAVKAKSSLVASQGTAALQRSVDNGSLTPAIGNKITEELYSTRGDYRPEQKNIIKTEAAKIGPRFRRHDF